MIQRTQAFLDECANEGLRTLILAQKEVDPEFYEGWHKEYFEATQRIAGKEKAINAVAEQIEQDLTLIGSTAIEDKLQDEVGETISAIRSAGTRFWVLTGDKVETAINIGFNCQVLDREMEIFILNAETTASVYDQLRDALEKQELVGLARDTAVVVGGEQLTKITAR